MWIGEQMAYNVTKLSKIVKERDKAQNWLDYFELKQKRNPATRPMTKAGPLLLHFIFDLQKFGLGFSNKPICSQSASCVEKVLLLKCF